VAGVFSHDRALQYELLWVQPLAMLLGVVMLSAVSYQTLTTGARPFQAMKTYVHPAVAWAWLLATLGGTVIWHLPQYALAAGMTDDMIKAVTGFEPSSTGQTLVLLALGIFFLTVSTLFTWSYGTGHRGVRLYERVLKSLVWMVIFAFLVVVVRRAASGGIEWAKVFKGMLPLKLPTDSRGVSVVMAAFAGAVGINMTFIFPYSLLARRWSKEHRSLARFDLITGMLIPYSIATTLMIIATGCTIYSPELFTSGSTMLAPSKAAMMIESAGLGTFISRIIFGLGILGMALSTISVQMLVCGFAGCVMFGVEPTGWRYRLACLIPAPAMVGVILWKHMGPWIAVPTTAICGTLLPIAYIAFFILNNSRKYLGEARPAGGKALVWNTAMLAAILVSLTSVGYFLYTHLFSKFF
jgi:hypothetical protein